MIRIFEDYYIKGDSNCYSLAIKEKNKKGEDVYRPLKYYTTIQDLVKGFINLKSREYLSNEKLQTLNELKNYQEKLYQEIEKNICV